MAAVSSRPYGLRQSWRDTRGQGVRFLFRGSVTKPGRTIIVADGQAYAFAEDGEAKLIATMTGTMMTIRGREGVSG
jgi:acyl-coenzyme A thioesterase PaaI-like protein